MLNLTYPQLLRLFPEHIAPERSESASFLIWYLENYYRLDSQEAIDAVCDQRNDRGVDGIFVNDDDSTITILQSKISQTDQSSIGDKSLREFVGSMAQFETRDSIQALLDAAGTAQVAALVRRLDLLSKIDTHQVRGEFVSNIDIDSNGESYLDGQPRVAFVGRQRLQSHYISSERQIPKRVAQTFDVSGFTVTEYIVDENSRAMIAPVKAKELVRLDGISDQSLYALNVRGPLGGTSVNRAIVQSIKTPSLHKTFPLFHNGITIIAKALTSVDGAITIDDYFVVNGCQSLTALYENQLHLSDDLRILTKIIKADSTSKLAKQVTDYSNNQNGVKARDFMANNAIQIRLQNEFRQHYAGSWEFEIKRGEAGSSSAIHLSNEDAGLMLVAFDLKEPWTTHRKYQVFDAKHSEIFGRPEVTADRIVLCASIVEEIDAALGGLENKAIARYKLTVYMLLYAIRCIMEADSEGRAMIAHPDRYVRDGSRRMAFKKSIRAILAEAVVDLNIDSKDWGPDFDYRGKLRDSDWVRECVKRLLGDHQKQIARNKTDSLAVAWAKNIDGSV